MISFLSVELCNNYFTPDFLNYAIRIQGFL